MNPSNTKQSRESQKPPSPVEFLFKTPQEYFNMFRERWPIGFVAAALAATGLLYWESQKPELYQTEATLLFEPRSDQVVAIENVVDTSLDAGKLNVHREWLQSRSFFDYVASFFSDEEVAMIQKAYIDPTEPDARPPSLAAIIRPNISAYIRRDTTIIGITVKHKDPSVAAFLADRYARRYIDFNLDRAVTGTQSAIVFLQDQANDLRQQVEIAERELQDYREKHNVASLQENQNVVLQRVKSLGGEIVQAQIERLKVESDLAKISEFLEAGEDLTEIPYIKEYGNIASLIEQRDNLRGERDRLSIEYLRMHPRMIENERAIESVENRIQRNIEQAITDLRTRHDAALQHENRLAKELLEAESASLELDRLTVDYRFLEREAETARASYAQIITRLNETNIAAQLENINIRLFDTAWIPSTPIEPNMTKMAIQSGMLGFLLLVGIPIGIGLIDNRLKTSWDVEEMWGKPIGEIPRMKGVKVKQRPHVVLNGKQEAPCQGFLGIYSYMQIDGHKEYPRSFLITSSLPKEGKSVVSNNLATIFAQHGKRTLLIDCDFRRPTLHAFYSQPNKHGFLKIVSSPDLSEAEPLHDLSSGLHCPHEYLHVLFSGGFDRHPSRLFDQPAFESVLKSARQHYDVVILDTPPVGIFPDALLLSRFVDETFFVCRFNRVNKTRLRNNIDKMKNAEAKFGGIIVNGIPAGRRSAMYDYHGFGSYSDRKYAKYYAAVK